MTGTELKIVTPAETEILGPEVDRLPTLHTNARTDRELLEVWLKSHRDGSAHTVRVYARVGERFVAALGDGGLRRATVEGVQAALEAMRVREDGQPVKDATVNIYVGAVKSFLGFAHRVGYTRFNAAPFIKLKKAPRQVAQRILGELETRKLIDAANPGRDRLMLEVAYYGGLRVSELVSLTWAQVIERDSGEAQLEVVGKGDKARQVLIPPPIATRPAGEPRRGASRSAPVFESVRNPGHAPDRAGGEFHRQGRSQARRRQPGRLRALAAARARQPRDRQRRAHHAGVGDARPCGSEDDVGLRPRPAGRELGPISEDEVT